MEDLPLYQKKHVGSIIMAPCGSIWGPTYHDDKPVNSGKQIEVEYRKIMGHSNECLIMTLRPDT